MMPHAKRHITTLISLLCITGIAIFVYRWFYLGIPLTATEKTNSFIVELNLHFKARNPQVPVKVEVYLPSKPVGYAIIDENFLSRGYGATINHEKNNRLALWTKRRTTGVQSLYYRALLYKTSNQPQLNDLELLNIGALEAGHEAAIAALLQQAREQSADIKTFAAAVLKQLNNRNDNNAAGLLNHDYATANIAKWAQIILAKAKIKSIAAKGFFLHKQRETNFSTLLTVQKDKEWTYFDPDTAEMGLPKRFFIWQYGDKPIYSINNAKNIRFSVSVSDNPISALSLIQQRTLSLLVLPLKTQHVYQILLTIPLGALVILLLRNFIGITTFGTFMPVLIAVAFRETHLLIGVFLFSIIILLGLLARFYLEQLRLLHIPRLTAVLTFVISIMLGITFISHYAGFESGLSVALFPMVILSMTIERMCIVWEERGASDAFRQGGGSLLAASLAYSVMSNEVVEYLFFVFPELLLVILALILWLGQYRGYRLTELYRFKALAN